jgi:hypothetical protein
MTQMLVLLPHAKTKIYKIMRLKKFFTPAPESNGDRDTQPDLDFKSEPKLSCHAIKKINATMRTDRTGH